MLHKERREMSAGPSSLFNDNPHNGGFCLLCAYLWRVNYHGAGFYWLLLFLRDFLGWDGTSEDCLQASRNLLLSGRSWEMLQTADGNRKKNRKNVHLNTDLLLPSPQLGG